MDFGRCRPVISEIHVGLDQIMWFVYYLERLENTL